MNKHKILLSLVMGCCLTVYDSVLAQNSSESSNIFQELGLEDLPTPPDVSSSMSGDFPSLPLSNNEVQESSASKVDDHTKSTESSSTRADTESETDSILKPLDQLDEGISSFDEFKAALKRQRKLTDKLNDKKSISVVRESSPKTIPEVNAPKLRTIQKNEVSESDTFVNELKNSLSDTSNSSLVTNEISKTNIIQPTEDSDLVNEIQSLLKEQPAIERSKPLPSEVVVKEVVPQSTIITNDVTEPAVIEQTPAQELFAVKTPEQGNASSNTGTWVEPKKIESPVTGKSDIDEILELISDIPPVEKVSVPPATIKSSNETQTVSAENPSELNSLLEDLEEKFTSQVDKFVESTAIAPEPVVDSLETNPSDVTHQYDENSNQIVEVQAKNWTRPDPEVIKEVETPFFPGEKEIHDLVESVDESDLQNKSWPEIKRSQLDEDLSQATPEVSAFMQKYAEELEQMKGASENISNIVDAQTDSIQNPENPEKPLVLKNAAYESTDSNDVEKSIAPPSLATELQASNEIVPFIAIDEAPLQGAIRQLARQSGINFIFDPKIVDGKDMQGNAIEFAPVTVRFENVTALQALDALLDSYGLALEPNKKTRIAKVTFKRAPAEEPLESQVIQLKFHAADEMSTILTGFIGSRSSITAHSKSSKIVVNATKAEMEQIAELVYELDVPSKNVLIEANILETSKNPKSLRGIDWSGTFADHQFNFGNGTSSGTQNSDGSNNISTSFSGSGASLIKGAGFTPQIAFLNSDGLNAVLNFLNSDNQTRVVATPRTVTQNGVEATLEVTRAFPIFQESPGSQAVPATTTIIYTNLGTILRVQPRISADDSVTLDVRPEVSSVDGKDQSQVGGRVSEANIYAIRRMQTTVRVPSGHTLVMGGLSSDTRSKKQNKVPLLGDIPLVGKLFQSREKSQENQNLIVFITPTIVTENDYQPTESDFLRSKLEKKESDIKFESLLDSAEPYDWSFGSSDDDG